MSAQPNGLPLLEAAQVLAAGGNSVIACGPDKAPKGFSWKKYQSECAAPAQLRQWFDRKREHYPNVGVVMGAVSGGREMIDIDNKPDAQAAGLDADAVYASFAAIVETQSPGLIERLPLVRSRSGGFHLDYRQPGATVAGNTVLAAFPCVDEDGKPQELALIETRGEGGLSIVPPSPGYTIVRGTLEDLVSPPEISEEEHHVLWDAARSLDQRRVVATEIAPNHAPISTLDDERPGDIYNRTHGQGDVANLLVEHGWHVVNERGGNVYVLRPGQTDSEQSGNVNENGIFFCHSSNAYPFKHETPYSPFAVFTLLEHDSDFSAAGKALYEQSKPRRIQGGRPNGIADTTSISEMATGDHEEQSAKSGKVTQATLLVELAGDLELFHDAQHVTYVTLALDGHKETWPLIAKAMRQYLARLFYQRYGKAPGSQAVADALAILRGKALFDGPELPVHLRLAAHEGTIYLDIGDPLWHVIQIDALGWRLISDPPVRFRRTRGMLPLPMPTTGGTIAELRPFLNLDGDEQWALAVAWLIGAYSPTGPYPILNFTGEQGTAKSTNTRVLRSLVDPNVAPIRTAPRDERDLAIAANNGRCPAFDNLSTIPSWLSDALCRISTGGGFATRALYENDEETIFDHQRPMILNGIVDVVSRPDLIDRTLFFDLPRIEEGARQTEAAFWLHFESARPRILGAILTAVSTALANVATTKLATMPRLADFATWVSAAEPALPWELGAFLAAYTANRERANSLALEGSPVAVALIGFLERAQRWEGTATKLLTILSSRVDERTSKEKSWPRDGRALSGTLRRLAPNLRTAGITLDFERQHGGGRTRIMSLEWVRNSPSLPSHSVPASQKASGGGGKGRDANRDANRDAASELCVPPPDVREGNEAGENDDRWDDGTMWDDEIPPSSQSASDRPALPTVLNLARRLLGDHPGTPRHLLISLLQTRGVAHDEAERAVDALALNGGAA